jgi:hypothetical protein
MKPLLSLLMIGLLCFFAMLPPLDVTAADDVGFEQVVDFDNEIGMAVVAPVFVLEDVNCSECLVPDSYTFNYESLNPALSYIYEFEDLKYCTCNESWNSALFYIYEFESLKYCRCNK